MDESSRLVLSTLEPQTAGVERLSTIEVALGDLRDSSIAFASYAQSQTADFQRRLLIRIMSVVLALRHPKDDARRLTRAAGPGKMGLTTDNAHAAGRGNMMLPVIGLCTHARHPSAAATALTLALMSAGCSLLGPSASFEGEWTAPAGKSYTIGLSLRQSGDTITGVACATDTVALYNNAPVTGDYPTIRVTVTAASTMPCCPHLAGQTFTAEMEKRGEIVTPTGVRFKRSTGPACR